MQVVSFTRPLVWTGEVTSISQSEPRVSSLELPGPPARRLDRKLALSPCQTRVPVWWAAASQEVLTIHTYICPSVGFYERKS